MNDSVLKGLMNDISRSDALIKDSENTITKLKYTEIKSHEENFYGIRDIEELKEDILIHGLLAPLVVHKEIDGYILLSGHRRFTAVKTLIDEGHTQFENIPTIIKRDMDDLDKEFLLIQSNATTRELNEIEKVEQAKRLFEILETKKNRGDLVPGRIRDHAARMLQLSPAQAERYNVIGKKLIPELQAALSDGKIAVSTASEIARFTPEKQNDIFDTLKDGDYTRDDATKIIKGFKEDAPNITVNTPYEVNNDDIDFVDNTLFKISQQLNVLLAPGYIKQERLSELLSEVNELNQKLQKRFK